MTYYVEVWVKSSVTKLRRFESKLSKGVKMIDKESVRREEYRKLEPKPIRDVCRYFTLIRVLNTDGSNTACISTDILALK